MSSTSSSPRIYGIRHHGPGSAHSLAQELERNKPDCLLVEGPPDAASVLPLLAHEEIRFPVALLLYVPDAPNRAVYYPFAEFSPETTAILYALKHKIPVRFMDLPMAHSLACEPVIEETIAIEPADTAPEAEVPETEMPET